MSIISKIQIEGWCKKVSNQDVYGYPETPASVYRLARSGDDQWGDYPELKWQWEDQLKAAKVAQGNLVAPLAGFPADLWKHQVLVLQWITIIHSGLLWAHMGTGKTRIILELLNWDKRLKKVLIVCPLAVIDSWLKQVEKWMPQDIVVSVRGPGDGIVIQNFESVWRGKFGNWTAKQKWDLVVVDECQNIKNSGSKVSRYFAKISKNIKKRIAMSGTPVTDGPLDAFGIYKFLDPGIFGNSYKRFEHRYAVVIDHEKYTTISGYRNMADFHNCFDFLCLQIKSDVLDLPPISYSTILAEMPPEARQFYDEFEKEFIAYLQDDAMSAPNILTKLTRLQGLTSGVARFDNGEIKTIHESKAEVLRTLLEGLDEPVVVFGRFRHDLEECERVCRLLKRSYAEFSGTRKELSDWSDVLGVQIRTGKTGIDLTKSSIAIFLSTGYSGGDYEQAICRLHRPPQNKPIRIINIHCKNTLDEKIARIIKNKQDIVRGLRK